MKLTVDDKPLSATKYGVGSTTTSSWLGKPTGDFDIAIPTKDCCGSFVDECALRQFPMK